MSQRAVDKQSNKSDEDKSNEDERGAVVQTTPRTLTRSADGKNTSVFLLSTIEKFLINDRVRCLLDDESQIFLREGSQKCGELGMKLVSDLYWRLIDWHPIDELLQKCSEEAEKEKKKRKNNSDRQIRSVNHSRIDEIINYLFEDGWIIRNVGQGTESLGLDDQYSLNALESFSQLSISRNNDENVSKKRSEKYKLSDTARNILDKLFTLMYLGINSTLFSDEKLEQKLINEELNTNTYSNNVIDDASVVFGNKDEYDRYFEAYKMYKNFITEKDVQRKSNIIISALEKYKNIVIEETARYQSLPAWLCIFTPSNIYVDILDSGVQVFKGRETKNNRWARRILECLIEQNYFKQDKKADWYSQLALILHKYLKRSEEAVQVLLKALTSNLREEDKDCIRPRAWLYAEQKTIKLNEEVRNNFKLHAKVRVEENFPSIQVTAKPMGNPGRGRKQQFMITTERGSKLVFVEEYCILYLIDQKLFTHGGHWEGRIVTTMFFLLFWVIIYASPSGARGLFLSHYQRHPLDMFCDSFYENRKTLIDDRLLLIEESTQDILLEMMKNKWDTKSEYELSHINRNIKWKNIEMVANCLGGKRLSAICRRLAQNYGYTYTGFPDCTMWNVNTKKISFVEVKSDGDHPSVKQLQWMNYLRSHGIDTMFFYLGVSTKKGAKTSKAPDSHNSSIEN